MSKKVLIMTQNFYPVIGSAGNRMKNIYQLLNQNNIETDVLTTEPAYPNKNLYKDKKFWDDTALNEETKKIIRVRIKNRRFSNHFISRLFFYLEIMYRFLVMLWKLRKEKYDYIYVSTPPIFIVFSALIGRMLMRNKLILEVRDLWPDSLVGVKTFDHRYIIKFFRLLEKRMYRTANYIVINSIGFKNHIKDKIKEKETPIIYLPNGPRMEELVAKKDEDKVFRAVYTGNIGLAQDINRLKQLATLLNKKDIHFDVIGYGVKAAEFTDYIKRNHLYNVHVHQPTTRKESLALIKNSDVAIAFLNDEEVFSTVLPGKVIDYMTCRTPVMAGIKGVTAEMITENNTGFVFEYDDLYGMVKKIISLQHDPKQLYQLGENCSKTIKDQFLWEKNITHLLPIFRDK